MFYPAELFIPAGKQMLLSDHCLCDDNECCTIQFKRIYIASVTVKLAATVLEKKPFLQDKTLSRTRQKWGDPSEQRKKGDRGGGRNRREDRRCDCYGISLINQSSVYDWLQAGETEQLISSQLSCKSSLHVNTTIQIQPTVAQIFEKATKPHKASFLIIHVIVLFGGHVMMASYSSLLILYCKLYRFDKW